MFLSRACELGIQAILYLAKHHERPYIPVKEIAEINSISYHFLGKIVQTLTKKGLLTSYKGPKGGVRLSRDPDQIKLIEIVDAIDGLGFCQKCLIGLPKCGDEDPCAIHDQWGEIRSQVSNMFENKTIAALIEE
ncbi:Rrf2 family transcriptional regulator [candidate division KSB1 bacterium]|nr:Rrf2 family transcriptional regulator [candidate division KSB1 bacterium]